MKRFFFLLILFPILAQGLEVDEKLTVRVIKSSESKKTLMINRGTEDGLVEGDHAKFIVTAGIVARAVCIKVSPTRSVWSVYRLVNADFVLTDAVMTIKISPPVKITKDETQTLVQDDTPTKVSGDPTSLGIPLAEGAQDMTGNEDAESAADLKSLEEEAIAASIAEKFLEVYGMLNISVLSASSKTDGGLSYSGSQSTYHVGLGGEYYPQKEREWYSSFSVLAGFNLMRSNSMAYNGASVTNDVNEFSIGTNWHPFTMPSSVHKFIPFFHLSGNFGTAKSTYKQGSENQTSIRPGFSANGTSNGFALGFGYKFYTHKGFGARILADYYMRAEKYKQDTLGNAHSKTVAGPRIMLGISYRF